MVSSHMHNLVQDYRCLSGVTSCDFFLCISSKSSVVLVAKSDTTNTCSVVPEWELYTATS
jgi:hypothetical protein